ncbi:MAG TPA: hypothetical protein VKQ09_02520 [Sphingomonas sp.]|nr:hypothetical protein [Sphingomonas sp.]
MKRPVPFLALSIALAGLVAGCASVSSEDKVRDKLVAAGVKPHMADCMADKLVRKLDYSELKELTRVAKLPREHPGALSFDELTYRLQAINNPHIVSVVTRAGLGCAIAG